MCNQSKIGYKIDQLFYTIDVIVYPKYIMSSFNLSSNTGYSVYASDPFKPYDNGPCCVFIPVIHRKVDEEQMAVILIHIGVFKRIEWVELTPPKDRFRSAYVHFDDGDRNAIVSQNKHPLKIWYSIVDCSHIYDYWVDIQLLSTDTVMDSIVHRMNVLEDSLCGSIHIKEDRIRDLEETVTELHTMLMRQSAQIQILQNRIPPIPLRAERQIAQTFPTTDKEEDELMSITTQSTRDSMPPLAPIDDLYWEYYQPL